MKEILNGKENIAKVIVNGITYSAGFEQELREPVALTHREEMRMELVYKQLPDETGVTIERAGLRIYVFPRLSDFRDRSLSTHSFSRLLIRLMAHILYGSLEYQ